MNIKKTGIVLSLIGAGILSAVQPGTASAAELPSGAHRIGILSGGTVSVKEGDLYQPWLAQAGDVAKFEIEGDRIGVLTNGGDLLVKEGNLYASWTSQIGGIRDFHLAGNRIGALRTDGSLTVKDGTLQAGWVDQIGGVTDFDLTPTRLGVVTGGLATVKEGDLYAGWVNQMSGVKDIELAGNRVGLLRQDGSLAVKEGTLFAGWTEQASNVGQADLAAASDVPAQSVSIQDLRNIWGTIGNESVVAEGLPNLNAEMARGGIITPARKAAFLATLRHESGFRYNAVEAGQTATYRGRGYIQLTSEANYRAAGNALGQNFVANPDAAASLQWSASIARWYWTVARADSNGAADRYDMGLISRYVGYAPSASEDLNRCNDFKAALRYFNGGSLPVADSAITCYRH